MERHGSTARGGMVDEGRPAPETMPVGVVVDGSDRHLLRPVPIPFVEGQGGGGDAECPVMALRGEDLFHDRHHGTARCVGGHGVAVVVRVTGDGGDVKRSVVVRGGGKRGGGIGSTGRSTVGTVGRWCNLSPDARPDAATARVARVPVAIHHRRHNAGVEQVVVVAVPTGARRPRPGVVEGAGRGVVGAGRGQ